MRHVPIGVTKSQVYLSNQEHKTHVPIRLFTAKYFGSNC